MDCWSTSWNICVKKWNSFKELQANISVQLHFKIPLHEVWSCVLSDRKPERDAISRNTTSVSRPDDECWSDQTCRIKHTIKHVILLAERNKTGKRCYFKNSCFKFSIWRVVLKRCQLMMNMCWNMYWKFIFHLFDMKRMKNFDSLVKRNLPV